MPKSDDKAALMRMQYQLKHTLSLVSEHYLQWLLDDLKEAIDNDELEKVDRYTELITSELVNLGWSPRSLNRLVKYVCFTDGPIDEMWQGFSTTIAAELQPFHCYYVCRGNTSLLVNGNITVVDGQDVIDRFPNCSRHISPDSKYIPVEPDSRYNDLHSAVEQSKHYISKIQAIVSYNKTDIEIGQNVIVVFPCELRCISYNIEDTAWKSTAKTDHPYFVTIEGINDVLINMDQDLDGQTKITNLLKQYQIALEAVSPETWFINLWIALESFVVTGQHASIIEHVKKLIPSILCSTYTFHLLKSFLEDCSDCGITPSYNGRNINTVRPTFTDIENLLFVLQDQGELNNLLNLCSDYSLMYLKAQKLASYFIDNNTVKDLMKKHYNNIAWHLQRLYRVRNGLIHSSQANLNILPLVSHLNHYLRATLSQIIYRLGSRQFKSLHELFSCFEDNYLATIEVLSTADPRFTSQLVLKGAFFY